MFVTLTFDNGPDAATTPAVLDVLEERGIPAYFFLVGSMLDRPGALDCARRAVAAGHIVGNHSLTHRVPLGDDPDTENVRREILDCEALLAGLNPGRLFRPFGGGGHIGEHLLSPDAVDVLVEGGYTVVLWNAVPRDWEDPDGWPEVAREQCGELDHAVVVLHDLATGAMDHLARFVDAVAADGATFTLGLPDGVVPVREGRVVDLEGLVCR